MGRHRRSDRRHARPDVPEAARVDPHGRRRLRTSRRGQACHTGLRDIVLAVQTEIPLVKQHLCDRALGRARAGRACATRVNRLTGETQPLRLRPSVASTHRARLCDHRALLSRVRARSWPPSTTRSWRRCSGPPVPGKAQLFEDQYISSGGQLYELMSGHDRFVADLRPLVRASGRARAAPCALLPSVRPVHRAHRARVRRHRHRRARASRSTRRSTSRPTSLGRLRQRARRDLVEPVLQPALDAAACWHERRDPADLGFIAAHRGAVDARRSADCSLGRRRARAPGRLDVMGGIADYSGSLVLQWPIRESTRVALQCGIADRVLNIVVGDAAAACARVDVPLDALRRGARAVRARRAPGSHASADRHWAAYVAGVFPVLAREDVASRSTGRHRRRRIRRARGQGRQLVGRPRSRDDGGGAGGVVACRWIAPDAGDPAVSRSRTSSSARRAA